MRLFAFISRHQPTPAQRDLAMEQSIDLHWAGDHDAFSADWAEFKNKGYQGVIVVHPWAALSAFRAGLSVGVFNNVNRAAVGEPPRFETTALYVAEVESPAPPDSPAVADITHSGFKMNGCEIFIVLESPRKGYLAKKIPSKLECRGPFSMNGCELQRVGDRFGPGAVHTSSSQAFLALAATYEVKPVPVYFNKPQAEIVVVPQ